MKKGLICIIMSLVIFCSQSVYADDYLYLNSKAVYMMDARTGKELYSLNADELRTPASMTKMLTLFVVFDEMSAGRLNEDTVIPISENVQSRSMNYVETNVPLYPNKTYYVSELISAICVVSANASAIALAEYISGSEKAFTVLMNKKIEDLGLDGVFYDSCGISPMNSISARSMTLLNYYFISEYPEILNYTSIKYLNFHGAMYASTNQLLQGMAHGYDGVDGIKTGFTTDAGFCMASTAKRDDSRIIITVMGADTPDARFKDIVRLYDYGFQCLESNTTQPFLDVAARTTYSSKEFIPAVEIKSIDYNYLCYARILVNNLCVGAESLFSGVAGGMKNDVVAVKFDLNTDLGRLNFEQFINASKSSYEIKGMMSTDSVRFSRSNPTPVTCYVSVGSGRKGVMTAGWYLDGEPIEGCVNSNFLVSGFRKSIFDFESVRLEPGEHTLSFKISPNNGEKSKPYVYSAKLIVTE